MQENQINCPNCGEVIDVQDILAHKLEEELKKKYEARSEAEKRKLAEAEKAFQAQLADFEERKRKENELFTERLNKKLREQKAEMSEKLKLQLREEQESQFKELQQELKEKSDQIKELNRTKAEIERLKREKEELKEVAIAEAEKKLSERLEQEKERIKKFTEEQNELRFRDLQKQLEDQKKLTEEMRRKQEQGSMERQGEVQEDAIEQYLSEKFPFDVIQPIKKGARGGDCVQIVNTREKINCGQIYYESKRTKDWQKKWIEKFKADMREKGTDLGVLVTQAMPPELDRMGLIDGVWVCTFEEFKGLCFALRESLIKLSSSISAQENKGDKMSMLYDFLTGNEFRMQIEAIVEGFTQMKSDLESEKRSMQRIWKQRDMQIEKVLLNTTTMYGSLKGIAGNAIGSVKALELGGGEV